MGDAVQCGAMQCRKKRRSGRSRKISMQSDQVDRGREREIFERVRKPCEWEFIKSVG